MWIIGDVFTRKLTLNHFLVKRREKNYVGCVNLRALYEFIINIYITGKLYFYLPLLFKFTRL
jgi:hypothetical protein